MDEGITALSQLMQLRICTGLIDSAPGITRATFRIAEMCVNYRRSQHDYRDPGPRAEYTLQISY